MQVAALFLEELKGIKCRTLPSSSLSLRISQQGTWRSIKNLSNPCSVTFPAGVNFPSGVLSILALQLQRTPSCRREAVVNDLKFTGLSENTCSMVQNSLTVIQFFVKVPVLSVQIWSAPPIVSEDASFLTQLFSLFIFMTENAKEIVTASGRPSGIAITITVTAVIKAQRKSLIVLSSQALDGLARVLS